LHLDTKNGREGGGGSRKWRVWARGVAQVRPADKAHAPQSTEEENLR